MSKWLDLVLNPNTGNNTGESTSEPPPRQVQDNDNAEEVRIPKRPRQDNLTLAVVRNPTDVMRIIQPNDVSDCKFEHSRYKIYNCLLQGVVPNRIDFPYTIYFHDLFVRGPKLMHYLDYRSKNYDMDKNEVYRTFVEYLEHDLIHRETKMYALPKQSKKTSDGLIESLNNDHNCGNKHCHYYMENQKISILKMDTNPKIEKNRFIDIIAASEVCLDLDQIQDIVVNVVKRICGQLWYDFNDNKWKINAQIEDIKTCKKKSKRTETMAAFIDRHIYSHLVWSLNLDSDVQVTFVNESEKTSMYILYHVYLWMQYGNKRIAYNKAMYYLVSEFNGFTFVNDSLSKKFEGIYGKINKVQDTIRELKDLVAKIHENTF